MKGTKTVLPPKPAKIFELTNEQRKFLGLVPIEKDWHSVKLNDMLLYFDGDIIRKKIVVNDNEYSEQELSEKTAEKRTILLPKTAKGKPKKLNLTATRSFRPFGIYFSFSADYVRIANYATQTTYFQENFEDKKTLDDLKQWVSHWIAESTESDLVEIELFKQAKRKHCKFKEGDFFTFKIGRRKWGFGRILINVSELRKTKEFKQKKNYGLNNLLGKSLIVKVYHKISNTSNIDPEELVTCKSLPPQAIMDNRFYYGEYKIIGNKELKISEYDEPIISYSKSFNSIKPKTIYLQYGLIYKEVKISKFNKYLTYEQPPYGLEENPYRKEEIGFDLNIEHLEQCIAENSNLPFWNGKYYTVKKWDLRNPANIEIKKEIFSVFGLDADKSYEENLKINQLSTSVLKKEFKYLSFNIFEKNPK